MIDIELREKAYQYGRDIADILYKKLQYPIEMEDNRVIGMPSNLEDYNFIIKFKEKEGIQLGTQDYLYNTIHNGYHQRVLEINHVYMILTYYIEDFFNELHDIYVELNYILTIIQKLLDHLKIKDLTSFLFYEEDNENYSKNINIDLVIKAKEYIAIVISEKIKFIEFIKKNNITIDFEDDKYYVSILDERIKKVSKQFSYLYNAFLIYQNYNPDEILGIKK